MFAIAQRARICHEGETLVYETAALPAELRRQARPTLHRGNIVAIALRVLPPLLLMLVLLLMIDVVKRLRQNKRLTNFPQRDAFRSLAERGLKAFDGFPEWLETEPERLMMHGHDKSRVGSVCHFNRLFGCAV
jgi:hypothetical protein